MLALKSGISLESTDLAKTNAYALKLTGTEYITLDYCLLGKQQVIGYHFL